MERRKFIKNVTLGSAVLPGLMFGLDSCRRTGVAGQQTATDLRQYDPTLRDRLWMWGHVASTINGRYNIPAGNNIDMADAIDCMGIPNVCVIRWGGMPEPPFDEFIKQFHKTKRVAWSILAIDDIDGKGDCVSHSFAQKKQWAFELREKMPNLVSFYLDDYFHYVREEAQEDSRHELVTLDAIRDLHQEVKSLKQPTDLSMVIYSDALRDIGPGIKPHLDNCDVVSFWTWYATNLTALKDNFRNYREIVPDKPTLLGIYMWDFGNSKPIPLEMMKLQLDFALEKFERHEIEGMIFHCTPLVGLGLEAVEYAKKWIAEHGDVT